MGASGRSYRDQVAAGVRLLDDAAPGWEAQVNLAFLNMSNCQQCILGQVFGDYGLGQAQVGKTGNGYGFTLLGTDGDADVRWTRLAQAWRRVVAKRLIRNLEKSLAEYTK